ncbi:MAG: beta-propeller domain-containing protein, partial [Clostridia bacterium]|nr:beta-propeller domain-containing protein [Clostridia bacterium]
MKKKNWYRALSLADDRYIAEADPARVIKPKRNKALISLIAACACFAFVACSLWLFIPFSTTPPDVSRYADSEYYELIQKLNVLTFEKPKHKNNAEKLLAGIQLYTRDLGKNFAVPEYDGMTNGATGTAAYQEITDNQVEGIIEADRIKRSDTHIYYLDGEVLRIYAIDKENTKEIGSYTLDGGMGKMDSDQWEFYLSSDCKTVTVVTQYTMKNDGSITRRVNLTSLDVSDPANIVKKEEFNITGDYMSSRKTNGSILLLTEFVIDKQMLDFSDESSFLPQIDEGDGLSCITADGIVAPEHLNDTRYTVVMKLDENTLSLEGTAAFLSYSDDVYVSENHVFLTRVFADTKENEDGSSTRNTMTEISCLTYGGNSFEVKGSATVRGYVKDQWSMDEYEGILRVFTTTNATNVLGSAHVSWQANGSASADILQTATGQSNASLYCIDLSTFETVASVIDFAPPREEM